MKSYPVGWATSFSGSDHCGVPSQVSGVPHAVPLQLMLTNCEKVLRANLEGFVAERVSNINKFEASSTMVRALSAVWWKVRGGLLVNDLRRWSVPARHCLQTSGSKVKHVHLMPFIEDFGPFVTRLEVSPSVSVSAVLCVSFHFILQSQPACLSSKELHPPISCGPFLLHLLP